MVKQRQVASVCIIRICPNYARRLPILHSMVIFSIIIVNLPPFQAVDKPLVKLWHVSIKILVLAKPVRLETHLGIAINLAYS